MGKLEDLANLRLHRQHKIQTFVWRTMRDMLQGFPATLVIRSKQKSAEKQLRLAPVRSALFAHVPPLGFKKHHVESFVV